MEMQRPFPVSMNEYEDSETTQTRGAFQSEDVYQCLQYRPPAAQGTTTSTTLLSKYSQKKYVFVLLANILISAIILVIVALNYFHHKDTQPTEEENEMWLLRDNVFYLFWSEHSDCSAAESFCSKRNASLAVLTERNKVWLMSRTNGKTFLVSRASSDGSGDTASPSVDDEDDVCSIMKADTDHGEGLVCERRVGTGF